MKQEKKDEIAVYQPDAARTDTRLWFGDDSWGGVVVLDLPPEAVRPKGAIFSNA